MVTSKETNMDEVARLVQERDIFKRQFLKIQDNYENKITELSILKELGNTLRSTNFRDKETFFWDQLKIIKRYTTLDNLVLMLLDEERNILEIIAESNSDSPMREPRGLSLIEHDPAQQAITEVSLVSIQNTRNDSAQIEDGTNHAGSLLYIPITHNARAIGVLKLQHTKKESFSQNHVRFFSLVADQIATQVILFRIYQQMLKEEKQRLQLTRFFSNTVAEKILRSGENLRLGGERKNVTILFSDLRGFTSMSEGLDQEKVVEILNTYFSIATPIVFGYDGTLDKLMGDGILAFFGAPLSHEDDTFRAVRTAVDIVTALKEFNAHRRSKSWPHLNVSIGINSGEVVAGYIGSEEHLNYTVIGDAVNVAQRLQSIAGTNEILVSKTVHDEIEGKISIEHGLKSFTSLPAQKLKGKHTAIEVYRVEI